MVAAERMDMLLREPTHFLKKKTEVAETPPRSRSPNKRRI